MRHAMEIIINIIKMIDGNAPKTVSQRAQATAEYAIIIGIIVAALMVMSMYIRRGLQARLKDAADVQMSDSIGGVALEGDTGFVTRQYEPNETVVRRSTQDTLGTERMESGGELAITRVSTGVINTTQHIYD